MENLTKDRPCSVCGEVIKCKCFYSDYGLVKLDNSGDLFVVFDACPKCLGKVIDEFKKIIHKD